MKVLVSGDRKFTDAKLMDRPLGALHRRKCVETLVTGSEKGAQEMAYYWGVRAHVPIIVTLPMQPDLTGRMDWPRWNRDVLKRFEVDGLVVFPGKVETEHMAELAENVGLRVWRVTAHWRG